MVQWFHKPRILAWLCRDYVPSSSFCLNQTLLLLCPLPFSYCNPDYSSGKVSCTKIWTEKERGGSSKCTIMGETNHQQPLLNLQQFKRYAISSTSGAHRKALIGMSHDIEDSLFSLACEGLVVFFFLPFLWHTFHSSFPSAGWDIFFVWWLSSL